MDSSNVQQPQSQALSQAKNVRNLSIKEFFATRLMRARSFEGGGNSPKDEPTNWFDEFKARMIKKGQSNKQSGINSSLTEDCIDESADSIELENRSTKISSKDDSNVTLVKEGCDSFNETNPFEAGLDLEDEVPSDDSHEGTNFRSITRFFGIRSRKPPESVERTDFETTSISTIMNRRDNRHDIISRKTPKSFFYRIFSPLKSMMSWLIPFNYNLLWKMITCASILFVLIFVALTSKANPDLAAFTFFNGFICGTLVCACCFIIVILGFFIQLLPGPQNVNSSTKRFEPCSIKVDETYSMSTADSKRVRLEVPSKDDLSNLDISDIKSKPAFNDLESSNHTYLDDENYKSWMIELISDYELRNKSDVKLKLIFVRIEGRILRLCKPKNSHDAESTALPIFTHQRIYDLNTVKKFTAQLLLPKTVRNRRKWVWSKKYPIRLEFFDDEKTGPKTSEVQSRKPVRLTLFAKSCREKEEWFRRFKRIIEENRLSQTQGNKRASIHSDSSLGNDDKASHTRSLRNPSPSPSVKFDGVQTSRSSNVLSDKSSITEGIDVLECPLLTRTRSCELLHADQVTAKTSTDSDSSEEGSRPGANSPDDGTLTRETVESFSQSIENSNFLENRPSLDYKDYIEQVIEATKNATSSSDWFNSLTGRIFFDLFSQNYWSEWFKRKIQRKLHRIRLPYFMETLTLTKIDLGSNAPHFLNVISHTFDSFGLSIDFDMAYSGGLTMTFETKLNLLKIKSDNSSNEPSTVNQSSTGSTLIGNQNQISSQILDNSNKEPNSTGDASIDSNCKEGSMTFSSSGSVRTSEESSDSDESESDSSSDSSLDDAGFDEISDWEDYGAEKTRQSIVRFVDKIASSRYFQHATENRYIKKKLQNISNCPLVLVVQIQSLNGVLTVNVPPPQTDRIWYGFKPNPELTLKALPKMGDRELNLSHVTDWIERKLSDEFKKILVIPNMEDIVLPVLRSDQLSYVTTTK